MKADGSGLRQLSCTKCTDQSIDFVELISPPAWSPDGGWLAVWGYGEEGDSFVPGIWKVRPDGTGLTRVFDTNFSFGVDWSPDGSKLVFENGSQALGIVNADGTGFRSIDLAPSTVRWPAWSPDGTKIAFYATQDGSPSHLDLINANGTGRTQLPARGVEPNWQPISGPQRSDYKNAAKFCQADRAFLGVAAFREKYGTNKNGKNAFGKCVSQNR
jgi:Tol biopolymer transport system component